MPVLDEVRTEPSHRVSDNGDKVTIHDLELFVGFIPGFDEDDSEIKDMDEDSIDKIVTRTKQHMSAGSNPKLVLLHQDDSGNAPPESIGDIKNIRKKAIRIDCPVTGEKHVGPGIVGDVTMSKRDFQSHIENNRFPRRSAEIWSDGHMSEVALLGRETPARPIRDTHFIRAGDKTTYTRNFQMVGPGPANTYVPDTEGEKMPMNENGCAEAIEKLTAQLDELQDDFRKYKAQRDDNAPMPLDEEDDESMYQDEDEKKEDLLDRVMGQKNGDEEDDDEMKAEYSRLRQSTKGRKVLERIRRLEGSNRIYKKKAHKANKSAKRSRYSRILDRLQADGYRVRSHRGTMLKELVECSNPEEKVKFWKAALARDPIGRRFSARNTRNPAKGNYTPDQKKSATDAAVSRFQKDGGDYMTIFNEELTKSG